MTMCEEVDPENLRKRNNENSRFGCLLRIGHRSKSRRQVMAKSEDVPGLDKAIRNARVIIDEDPVEAERLEKEIQEELERARPSVRPVPKKAPPSHLKRVK
jgi:hypothetical protein